jgi:hypothetical protein
VEIDVVVGSRCCRKVRPSCPPRTPRHRLGDHFYDQIAIRTADPRFAVTAGGLFEVFEHVNRDEDISVYEPDTKLVRKSAKGNLNFYHKWRTWQISDHSPLWVKITTDFADD